MSLASGDTIITQTASFVEMLFNTGDLVAISEQSKIGLDYARNVRKGQNTEINTLFGRIFVDVKNIAKKNNSFKASSPVATAAIRGTSFEFAFDPAAQKASLFLIEGKVNFKEKIAGKQVMLHENFKIEVLPGKTEMTPKALNQKDVDNISTWVGEKRINKIAKQKDLKRYKKREKQFQKIKNTGLKKAQPITVKPVPKIVKKKLPKKIKKAKLPIKKQKKEIVQALPKEKQEIKEQIIEKVQKVEPKNYEKIFKALKATDPDLALILKDKEMVAMLKKNPKQLLENIPVSAFILSNADYLSAHPELAKYLFGQVDWIQKYPKIAKQVYKNYTFLKQHPKMELALYKNRKWLLKNPDVALLIYQNKSFFKRHPRMARELCSLQNLLSKHPKIVRAISEHKDFLKKNPDIERLIRRYLKKYRKK
jgi:hypothetical protein